MGCVEEGQDAVAGCQGWVDQSRARVTAVADEGAADEVLDGCGEKSRACRYACVKAYEEMDDLHHGLFSVAKPPAMVALMSDVCRG